MVFKFDALSKKCASNEPQKKGLIENKEWKIISELYKIKHKTMSNQSSLNLTPEEKIETLEQTLTAMTLENSRLHREL